MTAHNVLRSAWQFRRVYDRGTRVYCRHSILFYLKTDEPGNGPLFGVVASKRVGNAVERNRAKRLLREALRVLRGPLTERDLWIVAVARKSILGCKTQDVLEDLRKAMTGEGLVRDEE